jgi:hypothetical protein
MQAIGCKRCLPTTPYSKTFLSHQGIVAMTDFSIGSVILIGSIRETDNDSLKTIVLFTCVGLIASLCLMTFGIDLSAGWI